MKNNSFLIRESDNKKFFPVSIAHWSSIRAEDGERDDVKYYGDHNGEELYVSRDRGHGYVVGENK